jgi:hypothetical protein
MTAKINILDAVALTDEIRDHNLVAGQVGTVVEILDDNVYEVEFSDNDGRTYAMLVLRGEQLITLHYALVAA